MTGLPADSDLTICFAHVAYRLGERFTARGAGIRFVEARDREALEAAIPGADIVVVSGLWRNELLAKAPKLRFIQSISAGVDQYDKDALRAAGVRLASAQGSNERAVAEHAVSLILAMTRQLHLARDNQRKGHWRGMIGDLSRREDELGGKTLVIVGLGRIGQRLATLAKAFDMRVIGAKRDVSTGRGAADEVVADDRLLDVLPSADFVALTCPLTPRTERIIDARALGAMKRSAFLINVARGKCVDEPALVAALDVG
ncbi:MAG: D-2-hydroxyacid dehydrogenase, partial [Rhodospirillales bacterium]|nr:D-2-hydroxyacid dehydrogenase [Rhodospirillales bacterium]